jgi:hypothetical protein
VSLSRRTVAWSRFVQEGSAAVPLQVGKPPF